MKKVLFSAVIVALMSGCATQSFTMQKQASAEPTKEVMQSFFISGLGQTQELNAAEICGGADKVAKVEAHLNFIDGLLGTLSFGIYTPRTAKVYCAG